MFHIFKEEYHGRKNRNYEGKDEKKVKNLERKSVILIYKETNKINGIYLILLIFLYKICYYSNIIIKSKEQEE